MKIWENFFPDPQIGQLFSGGGLFFLWRFDMWGFSCNCHFVKNTRLKKGFKIRQQPTNVRLYGVGRIGCHMSGDWGWGIPNLKLKPEARVFTRLIWAYTYPNNVIRAGERMDICSDPLGIYCYELANPVYPTVIYEAIMGIILFTIIWRLRKQL
ncbi:MAG: hypothetical protein CM15mP107_1400 [Bacteroidota bacterium]|nr:MAG: hypothetical protein CM15mP107_1400 [Bacteroidota bacterium]